MQGYLNLSNICLNYHNLKSEMAALKNVTFGVDKNEFVAIIGPSGCGKTTLLSIISNILAPSSGTITLDNLPLKECKKQIGYMFQKDQLFEWRTIQRNIELGLEINKNKTNKNIALMNNLLSKYGLKDFANKYPNELSGGMRQRVALIRTLVLKPKLLLLDEPFGALDYQTRQSVIDDVSQIISNEKITSILVTHDVNEALSMADKIIVLSKRPACVQNIIKVDLDKSFTPSQRKKDKRFNELLNLIWKELQCG